jgi:5,10-methylene-tetrahydrofolate dehydrogenase/methenyl tetrahydrofolate cyclohydrolase
VFSKETSFAHISLNINVQTLLSGILVQLPLPNHMDEKDITEAVDPKKDVDG